MDDWFFRIISPALTALVLIVGILIAIGKFKERSKTNEERLKTLESKKYVSIDDCEKTHRLMTAQIKRVSDIVSESIKKSEEDKSFLVKKIDQNNGEVLRNFQSINLFIGETKAIMDLIKLKLISKEDK